MTDRSVGKFKSCATISGAEERSRNILSVTKSPFEHQMGEVPQVLVLLCPAKLEAPAALWFPMDEAVERLTVATPRVEELKEVAPNLSDLRCVLVETTIPTTAEPAIGPMLPP